MRDRIYFLLKYYGYWLLVFLLAKFAFVLYQHNMTEGLSVSDYFGIIYHGLVMDFSLGGYIMLLVSLVLALSFNFKGEVLKTPLRWLNRLLLLVIGFVIVGDLELYRNWGFHLDTTPLLYLETPKEAIASVPFGLLIGLLISIVFFVGVFDFLYRKFIEKSLIKITRRHLIYLPVFLFIGGLMIIPIRGGLSLSPLNTGTVYFHENQFVNHAAVNPVWNFLYSLKRLKEFDKNYDCMPEKKAKEILKSLYKEEGGTRKVLKTDRPNIVFILLESFSAKMVEPLGGKKGVTPNLNRYCKEGLFFEHTYAPGNRSDKGIVSIISGYPPNPGSSMLKYPQKAERLPNFGRDIRKLGYSTAYYYGGDVNFANMRSYFKMGEFERIVSDEEFDSETYNSKWGVHDHIMFERFYNDLLKEKKPFFNMMFTLSSHEPFDVPMKPVFEGESDGIKYMNSVYYTDKCLGDFIEKCKKSELWDNTLFILCADHGVRLPDNDMVSEPKCFKIPMVWLGGALKDSPEVISTYMSQTDIVRTLLCQLDADNHDYIFSKNVFAEKVNSFSFYTYNDGVGFLNDTLKTVYDNTSKRYLLKEGADNMYGRAYLQILYNDFKDR
jgi:phosphoglycerol transferase MdoB-like AlkP superfamily enzyme